jgi:hypothetical protein
MRSTAIFFGPLALFAPLALALSLAAQSSTHSLIKPPDVEYLYPEQVTLPAGQPAKVVLHFRVGEGLHINSHSPHEQFLIPTTFAIPDDSGVRLDAATFPPGSDITLPFDTTEKLSVYTGEFTIDTRLIASAGNHLVEAKLHYQACNNSICLPPRTITVPIDIVGK